jgi:hypothetical protein
MPSSNSIVCHSSYFGLVLPKMASFSSEGERGQKMREIIKIGDPD